MSDVGKAQVRFMIAAQKIRGNRLSVGAPDDVIFKENNYSHSDDFWRDALSEKRAATFFIDLLEDNLQSPAQYADEIHGRAVPLKSLISKSLTLALRGGEPWIARDPLSPTNVAPGDLRHYIVEPRAAALWFLSRPMQRDKLPATLQSYLKESAETDRISVAQAPSPARVAVPGPKPGHQTAKDRSSQIALMILADNERRPPRGFGRRAALGRMIAEVLSAEGMNYRAETCEKHVRYTVNEWENKNSDK